MNMEMLMQFLSSVLIVIGIAAFIVSMVTQVIKEMPRLAKLPTNAVALMISMVICPVIVTVACQYFRVVIEWYYIFASFMAAFVVYLVSTGGWERVHNIWERTKYSKRTEGEDSHEVYKQ